jgi:hypothetical protein
VNLILGVLLLLVYPSWGQEEVIANPAAEKQSRRLFLVNEIDAQNFDWKDLGLENGDIFSKVINESWLKWFLENRPNKIEEVIACSEKCRTDYDNWSASSSEEIPARFPGHQESFFLNINIQLKMLAAKNEYMSPTFGWFGRVVLQEIQTKKIIGSYEIPALTVITQDSSPRELNSQLATVIYRSALEKFVQVNKNFQKEEGNSRVNRLSVKGHRHLGDIYKLVELLKSRGKLIGIEIQIDTITTDEVQLVIYHQSEEKSFSDLLSDLKELKSSHNYKLVYELSGSQHLLKLVTE